MLMDAEEHRRVSMLRRALSELSGAGCYGETGWPSGKDEDQRGVSAKPQT